MTPTPQRKSLLVAALGFALIDGDSAALNVLHSSLSTWTGIGHVITGMHRQGYDVLTGIRLAVRDGMAARRKRASGTRELLKTRTATHFARRTAQGRFKEMDERGRSLTADRRRKAKTKAKRGQGDRGDRAA